MTARLKRYVRISSFLFLGALFLYAGLDKAFHYGGFVKALGGYALIPDGLETHLGLPLILAEILVGVGLLLKSWRQPAALVAAGMLAAFTTALAVNQYYNPGAECGCWFTITLGRATSSHIVQNLILLGLAVSILLDERASAPAGEDAAELVPRRSS